MNKRNLKLVRDREHAETRVVDLRRANPQAAEDAGNQLLDQLHQQWIESGNSAYEFMYHVAWLGCVRSTELDEERAELDKQEHDDDEGDMCYGVPV